MSNEKISLQGFLNSKKQLLEAIQHDPLVSKRYVFFKYCNGLPVKKDDQIVEHRFKPKHIIDVQWKYILNENEIDVCDREVVSISFYDNGNYVCYTSIERNKKQLERWLLTNTRELI